MIIDLGLVADLAKDGTEQALVHAGKALLGVNLSPGFVRKAKNGNRLSRRVPLTM